VRRVHQGGEIKWPGRFRFVGEAFAGHLVGLKRQRRGIWKIYFYSVVLGQLHDTDATGIRIVSQQKPLKGPHKM
jgi:hypothetical protein